MTVIEPSSTESPETPEGDTPGTPETESGNQGLADARDRYRAERDTARDELTAATARIERMQRREIERLASSGLAHASDLFTLSGNELADYLDQAGYVDSDRVAADVAAILAERPGMRKPARAVDPAQGLGGKLLRKKSEPSFSDLFAD
ncbi:hypothetical protein [Mycolicibacterium obuense]|uniref:DUF4355 domain-containing protein n=1 Tax=Mycolicibacterium obuense TaxID=1807 RepID=A0A0J6VF68_9MYCO|nr:hypothetical protein [Mycolicibacterium obuense]KMO68899.1 hypothetical protein MOBUDSM44075_04319 [Mycolicibacterium obuense]